MKMKTFTCFFCRRSAFFLITLLTMLIGCEKENVKDPDENNSTFIISDTQPILKEETSSSSSFSSDTYTREFMNPFKGVELHDPTALALIPVDNAGEKKGARGTTGFGEFYLYEKTADSLQMILGQEGNDILFRNIE